MGYPAPEGLYDPRNEHDACGVGMVAHIKGVKSHSIVTQALEILNNIDHRGAVGADPLLGDGAGILLQIPDPLFRNWAKAEGKTLPEAGDYAVAMCFMPQDGAARDFVTEQLEKFIAKEGQILVGFALETGDGKEYAREKLEKKNFDFIVLNTLSDKGAGFGYDTNRITIIDRENNIDKFELKTKEQVAADILIKLLAYV